MSGDDGLEARLFRGFQVGNAAARRPGVLVVDSPLVAREELQRTLQALAGRSTL